MSNVYSTRFYFLTIFRSPIIEFATRRDLRRVCMLIFFSVLSWRCYRNWQFFSLSPVEHTHTYSENCAQGYHHHLEIRLAPPMCVLYRLRVYYTTSLPPYARNYVQYIRISHTRSENPFFPSNITNHITYTTIVQ